MSRDWTKEELHTASEVMKQNGYMGFEEFCHALEQKQPVKFDFQERNWWCIAKMTSGWCTGMELKIKCCHFQNSAYNTDERGNSSSTKFFRAIEL